MSVADPGTWSRELAVATRLAREAATLLRYRYEAGPAQAIRKPDGSPVTPADLEADALITAGLREAFPADVILSEESGDDPRRHHASRVWIVDPLDGTRDFLERSGDFAVHLALAVDHAPMVGVVALPVGGRLYRATRGAGAVCEDESGVRRLRVDQSRPLASYRTGITRTAMDSTLARFLARANLAAGAVPHGASVKHMLLAEGALDLCITLHDRESEWDTCAPGLIVEEAGGRVTDVDGAPFRYNQTDPRHRRGVLMSAGPHHDAIVALARDCFPA